MTRSQTTGQESARSTLRASLPLAAILVIVSIPATIWAGDEPDATPPIAKDDPALSDETPAISPPKRVNWWSIPRPARDAVRKLAASRDASVSRCVAIDHGDTIAYEFHASRRAGLFKRTDFVLTSVRESKAATDKRREDGSLKRRIERFREVLSPRPKNDVVGRTGFLDPNAK